MNYVENEDNGTSGRVKGSVKDRVISFFYRKRHTIKLQQQGNESVNLTSQMIKNAPRLNNRKFSQISIISDLNQNQIKYMEVNPETEEFDFDKYDYYLIRSTKKKGIAPVEQNNEVKGSLSKLSFLGVRGLQNRIEDSKKIIKDTSDQVRKVKINLQYPVLHREDMAKMYQNIRKNIDDLKFEYEIIKDETNSRSYALEESLNVMDKVDKYDPKGIETIETMLKVGLLELDKLATNVDIKKKAEEEKKMEANKVVTTNMFEKPVGYDERLEKDKQSKELFVKEAVEKKEQEEQAKQLEQLNNVLEQNNQPEETIITEVDINSNPENNEQLEDNKNNNEEEKIETKEENELEEEILVVKISKENKLDAQKLANMNLEITKLSTYEEKIAYELKRQKEIINRMYSKVGKVTKEQYTTYEIQGYGRLLSSFGKITAGVLTLPLTPLKLFNINVGAALINKGLTGMKKGLEYKEKINVDYKYEDLSFQINQQQNKLESAEILIDDSLDKLNSVRNSFVKQFSNYEYQIPDYHKTLKKLNELEHKLEANKKQINSMDKDLSNQKEKNKVMIKKVNNNEY